MGKTNPAVTSNTRPIDLNEIIASAHATLWPGHRVGVHAQKELGNAADF